MNFKEKIYWDNNKTKKDMERDDKVFIDKQKTIEAEIKAEIDALLKPFEDIEKSTDNKDIKIAMIEAKIKALREYAKPPIF